MIPAGEIWSSLYGAWRLAHGDVEGMRWFNLSIEGFFRSFFAAVLIFPLFCIDTALKQELRPDAESSWGEELVSYPVLWIVHPLVMALACRALGLGQRYAAAIIADNWASVLTSLMFLPVSLIAFLEASGAANLGIATVASLIASLAAVVYMWFTLRSALQTGGGTAAALTAISILIAMLVKRTVSLLA